MKYILLFYSNNSFDANLCYLHCGVKLIKLILCKWNKYKFLAINFCYKFYACWAYLCVCVYSVCHLTTHNAYCCNNNLNSAIQHSWVSWECSLCVCVYVWLLMRWFFPNIIICKLVTCILKIPLFLLFFWCMF